MKLRVLILLALTQVLVGAYALTNSEKRQLQELDAILSERPQIESLKRARIDSLYRTAITENEPYRIYKELYEEYKSYNYDTALIFVRFMEKEATQAQLSEVDLCRAFVFHSGGLFKEASDLLDRWSGTDSTLYDDYLAIYSRLMWDMADNAGGEIGEKYNRLGNQSAEILLKRTSARDTAQFHYLSAILDLREKNYTRSIERCEAALRATPPSLHHRAIYASTLAHLYRLSGDNHAALRWSVEAAICDIRSSTFETVAMRTIAELLFKEGETELANRYIHIAMHDAQQYNARYRQVSIAQSLPIIEEQWMEQLKQQQHFAWSLLGVVALLFCAGIVGIIVLARKNKAIHAARHTIHQMNEHLVEANKLKEELLGTLLVGHSQYLSTIAQYQQDVKENAVNRQWNRLLTIPKKADARLQRIAFGRQMDTLLLSLYPTFVHDFNNLLLPQNSITLKEGELLNTQLRIFALIRLGIGQNEIIADILDYSLNTIYNYKSRTMALSPLSADAFYRALMAIPSFSKEGVDMVQSEKFKI